MGDFWDHAFKALGHLADARGAQRAEEAERRPKRKVKVKPDAPAPTKSFDGPGSSSDPSCCITSRRTIKIGE